MGYHCRPAQSVCSALLSKLTCKVVGTKVRLHDQALEKLRQVDFVAVARSEKAEVL